DTKEGSVGISGNFKYIAELLKDIEEEIGGGILAATKSLVEATKGLNQYLGNTDITEFLDNVESAIMSAGAAFLALKVSRAAYTSETLRGIKADISAQGVFGALTQKIKNADAALQKKIATEEQAAASALKNAKAQRESAIAAETEAKAASDAAQHEVMRQEIATRKIRMLAESRAGTEQAARANTLLAASEKRLAEAYAASHAASARLAQASSAVSSASTRVSIQAANFDRVTQSSRAASVAFSGLKMAGSSLLALFGGPFGLALTAGGAALGYLATQQSEAEKYANSHGEALRAVSEDLNEAADAADRYAEKLKSMTQAQLAYENLAAQQNLQKLIDDYSSLRGAVANFFVDFGSDIEEYQKVWDITTPLEDIKNVTTEQLLAMRDSLLQYAIATKNVDGYKNAVEKMINMFIAAKLRTEQTAEALKNYNGENEKGTNVAQQAVAANNDLAAALDAVDKAGKKAPQSAKDATEWLLNRTAQSDTLKTALEEEAKSYDTLALAILNSAAAQAMMNGKADEAKKLFEKIGQFAKGLKDVYAGRTGGKSWLSDAKRNAEALKQAMADLEAQTNRLTMTDEQFREWELTNRTLPELMKKTKGATEEVKKFEEAQRRAWAKEDEKKAQEKARENLQTQADFYEQLREKSGQYGLGLEYVNKLIDQQAKAWSNAGIPQDYINQLTQILRLEADTTGWGGMKRAMRSYYADATNMGRQFEDFTTSTLNGLEDAFVDFTTTGKLSFSDLANSMISDLVRIAYKAMVIAPIIQGITGMFGGGSVVSKALGASNAAISAITPSAQGNVFSGGNISDYSGSIVTQPTAFSFGRHLSAFAGGGGIMGEAGPEAILPLDRGKNGRLGLAMDGMDDIMQQAQRGFAAESAKYMKFIAEQRQAVKPQVTVNIINQTGQQMQAQTKTTPDGQGGMNMDIVLTQIEAGIVQRDAAGRSQLINHIDRTRGLSRAPRAYR
ncbi:phage tail tape measure protein, partial [uncultured Desulfovibrio sp.]|uniref:phage tail tape measure protein n=1 Tax=uncultured Desulfovibrio sp. TaxID=167968 RepID=UPI00272B9741